MHYIMFANYGITGWASVAMPILPSAIKDLQGFDFQPYRFFCAKKNAPKMHRPRFYALLRAFFKFLYFIDENNQTTNPKKNNHLQYITYLHIQPL